MQGSMNHEDDTPNTPTRGKKKGVGGGNFLRKKKKKQK
jgi:hypothetical protein